MFKFCLFLLRFVTVCQGRGSPARYGLSRIVLRFLPACYVLLGPLTFCYVAIKFCYVYQVLSRFSKMKRGRWMVFEPQYAHSEKKRGPQSCCHRYIMHPWSKTSLMVMKKPISCLYNCWERTSSLCRSKEATSSCIEDWSSSRKVKDGCKVRAWFSEEQMQQLGYFSTFIARELRTEDVNTFQASKALRKCSMRVLKQ